MYRRLDTIGGSSYSRSCRSPRELSRWTRVLRAHSGGHSW
jgi:hypothetical protein